MGTQGRWVTAMAVIAAAIAVAVLFDDGEEAVDVDFVRPEPVTTVQSAVPEAAEPSEIVMPADDAEAPAPRAGHEDSATRDGMPAFELFRELRVYDSVTGVRLTHGTILTSPEDGLDEEQIAYHEKSPDTEAFSVDTTGPFPTTIEFTGADVYAWISADGYGWEPVVLYHPDEPLVVHLPPVCAVVLELSEDPARCTGAFGLRVRLTPKNDGMRTPAPFSCRDGSDVDLGLIPHGSYDVEIRRVTELEHGSIVAHTTFTTNGASTLRVPVDLTAQRAPPATLALRAVNLPDECDVIRFLQQLRLQLDDDSARVRGFSSPYWVESDGEWTVAFECIQPARYRVWHDALPMQIVDIAAGGETEVVLDFSGMAGVDLTFEDCATDSPSVRWRFDEDPASSWRWASMEAIAARPIWVCVSGKRSSSPMFVNLQPGVTAQVTVTCDLGSLIADLTIRGDLGAIARADLTDALGVTSDAGEFISWIPLAYDGPPLVIQMAFSEPGRYDLTFTTPDGRRTTFPIVLGGNENPAIELHWTLP